MDAPKRMTPAEMETALTQAYGLLAQYAALEEAARAVWQSRITYYVGTPADKALVSHDMLCKLGDQLIDLDKLLQK